MAITFADGAKNVALSGIRDYSASGVTNFVIGAYPTGGDAQSEIARSSAFAYNSPSGGAMALPSNIVINIPAGNTVAVLRVLKNTYPNEWNVVSKDITPEEFTFAGSITVTTATISINDTS